MYTLKRENTENILLYSPYISTQKCRFKGCYNIEISRPIFDRIKLTLYLRYGAVHHQRASPKFHMTFHNIITSSMSKLNNTNNINRFTGHNLYSAINNYCNNSSSGCSGFLRVSAKPPVTLPSIVSVLSVIIIIVTP